MKPNENIDGFLNFMMTKNMVMLLLIKEPVGGELHFVLDDLNVKKSNIKDAIEHFIPKTKKTKWLYKKDYHTVCTIIANGLLNMDIGQRIHCINKAYDEIEAYKLQYITKFAKYDAINARILSGAGLEPIGEPNKSGIIIDKRS